MKYGFPKPQLLNTVSSTNDYLKSFLSDGLPRVVAARNQTQGKGRHGRSWVSEKDQGLYVSFLCYPSLPTQEANRLNIVSALAVALSLEEICPAPLQIALKPPNDVLLDQGKICGILVETASLGEQISWAIIGIGINLTQKSFPFHSEPPPTSLSMAGLPIPPREIMYDILARNLTQLLRELQGGAWSRIEDEFLNRIWVSDGK